MASERRTIETSARSPTRPASAERSLPELTSVRLRSGQRSRDGRVVPAHTAGTIVEVLGGGRAYIVEFTGANRALITVDASEVSALARGET